MVLSTLTKRHWLAACAFSMALAGAAHAQTPALPASVFDSYKPYTDEPVANWKQANDTTARIGGWREYARQAQGLDSKPDNLPAAAAPAQATPIPAAKAKP